MKIQTSDVFARYGHYKWFDCFTILVLDVNLRTLFPSKIWSKMTKPQAQPMNIAFMYYQIMKWPNSLNFQGYLHICMRGLFSAGEITWTSSSVAWNDVKRMMFITSVSPEIEVQKITLLSRNLSWEDHLYVEKMGLVASLSLRETSVPKIGVYKRKQRSKI